MASTLGDLEAGRSIILSDSSASKFALGFLWDLFHFTATAMSAIPAPWHRPIISTTLP
jgi:hypothetical protein